MAEASDAELVRRLDRAWNDAYLRNDRSVLEEILADDFRGTFPEGRSIGKTALLEPTPARRVEFSELSFELFGPTAITSGRIRVEHPDGAVEQRFVRVYSKRNDRWQAVAVRVFPVVQESGDSVR
jgi:ketosteroid isomerase-like protein